MKSKTKGSLSGTPDEPQNTMARQRNTAGVKTSGKVEIGWLHFGSNGYNQVLITVPFTTRKSPRAE